MNQGTGKKPAAERARAARRIAQLRREAEERAEAEAKRDANEPLSVNETLALMGSALRVPDDTPSFVDYLRAAWEAGELLNDQARIIAPLAKERDMSAGLMKPQDQPQEHDPPAKLRKHKAEDYAFTAEDIKKLRDEVGLSWRQVAVNLDLGSPGAARKAYTTLTGRDFKESAMTGRRTKTLMGSAKTNTRKVYAPVWDDDSDQDEIIERLKGARIFVVREVKGLQLQEELVVQRVVKMSWDGKDEDGPLAVTFYEREGGGARTVRVQDIKEVH